MTLVRLSPAAPGSRVKHSTTETLGSLQSLSQISNSAILSLFLGGLLKNSLLIQAFRFMVDAGHCPIISKYGTSLSKAVGPVDLLFLVVKKSHFNKNIHLTVNLHRMYM